MLSADVSTFTVGCARASCHLAEVNGLPGATAKSLSLQRTSVTFRRWLLNFLASYHRRCAVACGKQLDEWAEAFEEAVRKDPNLIKKLKTPSDIDRHIKAPGLAERLQIAVGKVSFDLVRICPLLKHSKFSEEMEWRLVLPVSMTQQVQRPLAEFRPVRDTLIPYMSYPLPKREDGPIPMNDLIVGPGSHSEVEAAMSSFLRSCDLRVIPRKSDVPYRPW